MTKSNKRKNTNNSVLAQKCSDAEARQTTLPVDESSRIINEEKPVATKGAKTAGKADKAPKAADAKVTDEVVDAEVAEEVADVEVAEEAADAEVVEEVADAEAAEEAAEEDEAEEDDEVEEDDDDAEEADEADEAEDSDDSGDNPKAKKSGSGGGWFWKLCGVMGLIALVISIALCAKMYGSAPAQTTQTTDTTKTEQSTVSSDTTQSTEATVTTQSTQQTTQSSQTTQTTQSTVVPTPVVFDMETFKTGVNGIANGIAGEVVNEAFVNVIVDNIGEEQLKSWIASYGEIQTKQAVANFVAFAAEIEMQRFIANEGLLYNPNSKADYLVALEAADAAYTAVSGKNPNGAVMSLPNYDEYKSSRAAMEKLIADSGDTALLNWYKETNALYDLRKQQERDTEKALQYKASVEQKLVQSKGIADVIDLQMKKVADGTLTVVDLITYKYTDEYSQFVLQNWMYVLAK